MAARRGPMLLLLAAFALTLTCVSLLHRGGVKLAAHDFTHGLDRDFARDLAHDVAHDFAPRATTSSTATPTPTLLPYCNGTQITKMDMGSCRCRPQLEGCKGPKKCPSCTDCPNCDLIGNKTTHSCTGGCTDSESECEGCGLWFHTLCDCLAKPSSCHPSAQIQKNGPHIWVLTNPTKGDPLFTTTELMAGIQEMIKKPASGDAGWAFAQRTYSPSSQALALNPYRVRDQEQIHIHKCNKNTTTSSRFAKITDTTEGHLSPVAGYPHLHCLVLPKGAVATSFATSLAEFYPSAQCKDLIGAGLLRDDANRTWACATSDSSGPKGTFCK